MAVISFPARNKLAYPAGRPPGFDPAHPAATNLVFSCVPSVVGLVNLPTGKALTSLGGSVDPTYGIDGCVGPSLTMPASSKGLGESVSVTITGWTMAAIFDYTTNTGTSQVLISTNSTGQPSMWLSGNQLNYSGAGLIFSYNFILGHSYFVVTSRPFDSSSTILYILVEDLTTGQIYQGVSTTGGDAPVAVTSYTIAAGDSGSFNLGCPIAAAMAANKYIGSPQLLQWSADPWAFWYPPQAKSRVAAAAAVTTQYAAFSLPQRDGGVYTQMIGY